MGPCRGRGPAGHGVVVGPVEILVVRLVDDDEPEILVVGPQAVVDGPEGQSDGKAAFCRVSLDIFESDFPQSSTAFSVTLDITDPDFAVAQIGVDADAGRIGPREDVIERLGGIREPG